MPLQASLTHTWSNAVQETCHLVHKPEVSKLIQEVLELFRFNELILACFRLAQECLPNRRHFVSLHFDLQLCIWIGLAQTISLPRKDLNFLPESLQVSLYKSRIDRLATIVSLTRCIGRDFSREQVSLLEAVHLTELARDSDLKSFMLSLKGLNSGMVLSIVICGNSSIFFLQIKWIANVCVKCIRINDLSVPITLVYKSS